MTKHQTLANIAEICAQQGIKQVIISPGSRSAPLTTAFARHPRLNSRVVMDERAAGFIALGIAQQTQKPVALLCTSGTAALNYGPAVAEAFYQRIPLLIFSADRPSEWIDQQDGQTIRQSNLYAPHIRGSFQLPVEDPHPDAQWHAQRVISEATHCAQWPVPGPVHINVPLREPLYPSPGQRYRGQAQQIIRQSAPRATLPAADWKPLRAVWQSSAKTLIVAGMQPPQPALLKTLHRLLQDPSVTLIGDLIANVHQGAAFSAQQPALSLPNGSAVSGQIAHWEMILGTKSSTTKAALTPDLLISFGGPVVSKALKLFLRKYKAQEHWRIDLAGQPVDTYQSLTRVIPLEAAYFFKNMAQTDKPARAQRRSYQYLWLKMEKQAQRSLNTFLSAAPFGEFQATADILCALPEESHLQLANSMAVRYANILGLAGRQIRVNSNRGTSGIDGSLSASVGAALTTNSLTTLITGDLAFFYDRNGLWHNHVPPNLRIIILNNGGGGIFKLIDGPGNLPNAELEEYFFTPHPLTVQNTARDHNLSYFHAATRSELRRVLPDFFAPAAKAAILEIPTDSEVNAQVFQQFKVQN
ncbi:MAG TPA: 2-succinyl-5-enolpyruvyl-6-hydroxy-3-cyclohexene-1-carboxylic-acid synthase [Chloroflexi bacterium]|nr:2-succinyl-5-enolpyruvyl-6-hydroxy-3-cyclohexene-1-carboxylic-acid synthase [Chloroflexota bacterium]